MTSETTGRPGNTTSPDPSVTRHSVPAELLGRDTTSGIVWGAPVITTRGKRPIQELKAGDLVITRSNGVVAIDRIEQNSLVARAVYVLAGSIGHLHINRDTLLPAGQPVLVRDWRARAIAGRKEVIASAACLVDGEYIRDIGYYPMTVFRIYCKKPQVFYADGMELGTPDSMASQGLNT